MLTLWSPWHPRRRPVFPASLSSSSFQLVVSLGLWDTFICNVSSTNPRVFFFGVPYFLKCVYKQKQISQKTSNTPGAARKGTFEEKRRKERSQRPWLWGASAGLHTLRTTIWRLLPWGKSNIAESSCGSPKASSTGSWESRSLIWTQIKRRSVLGQWGFLVGQRLEDHSKGLPRESGIWKRGPRGLRPTQARSSSCLRVSLCP